MFSLCLTESLCMFHKSNNSVCFCHHLKVCSEFYSQVKNSTLCLIKSFSVSNKVSETLTKCIIIKVFYLAWTELFQKAHLLKHLPFFHYFTCWCKAFFVLYTHYKSFIPAKEMLNSSFKALLCAKAVIINELPDV